MSSPAYIPRRTFLKGLGATMALPLLEAMRPVSVVAGAARNGTSPVRMAFVFFPNGAILPNWSPEGIGKEYELSHTLEPLGKFKQDFNIVSGLAQDNGRAKGDGPGDHARCASTYLTGAHPVKTSGVDIKVGISVDQMAAQEVGNQTRLPSLELGIDQGRNAGNCDSGYSCAYSSNISWKMATTPMAKEINPRSAFERLFGVNVQNEKDRARRNRNRKSILDLVADDAARLKVRLGVTDRRKVNEYFTSVRELELRIKKAGATRQEVPEFDVPEERPQDLTEHIHLMYDLMVLAFQTDTTRIITFMLGNAASNRSYPMVGVKEGWHSLSHHGNDQQKMDDITKIDHYHTTQFAYFLEKLKSVQEGEGTLLDNSMIMYGSGLSDGNQHWHHDLPIVLAGQGGGTIKTGRHIKFDEETPLNNLFLSMLDRMDAKIASLGDSSGRLSGLEG